MRSQAFRVSCSLVVTTWLLSFVCPAQQDSGPPAMTASLVDPDAGMVTISKRVDEVNLLFTATDAKGRFVTDLEASDVEVLDNRLPPEGIRSFQKESDLPLRVGLVIDLSESITDRFKFEKKAAATFLKKSLRPTDQAFIVGFNQKVQLFQDFTGNPAVLGQAVQRMKVGGNTSFYDAVVFACRKLQEQRDHQTRKVLILITDGQDTSSKGILADAEQAAARAETSIFALSTNDLKYDDYPRGEAVLELLTRYAGGQILRARDTDQLTKAFAQVEQALRSQYVLAYKPANFTPDGSFRTIELHSSKPKLHIQCRRGYYAPREAQ